MSSHSMNTRRSKSLGPNDAGPHGASHPTKKPARRRSTLVEATNLELVQEVQEENAYEMDEERADVPMDYVQEEQEEEQEDEQEEDQEEDQEEEQEEEDMDDGDQGGDVESGADDERDNLLSERSATDWRSDGEMEGIADDIKELVDQIHGLKDNYQLVDRLGEGTFSSVYKARDLMHFLYDNSAWLSDSSKPVPALPTPLHTSENDIDEDSGFFDTADIDLGGQEEGDGNTSGASGTKKSRSVYVALKRIYVTSSPQRIYNELEILAELRSARNTAHLITAVRFEDQVLAVMPYEKHHDFRVYFRTATMPLIRSYFKCLLSALADAHKLGIIHRDVKPANFLFNADTLTGKLCDFGLAERFDPLEWHGRCLHSLPNNLSGSSAAATFPGAIPKEVKHPHSEDSRWTTKKVKIYPKCLHGWKLERPLSLLEQLENYPPDHPWVEDAKGNRKSLRKVAEEEKHWFEDWNKDMLSNKWLDRPDQRVGYLKEDSDKRPSMRANRAGTRGFRAPEVLLKCPDQTVSIDVWSAGIILLCFLTRRFPFFNSNDDVEALMELAALFGKKRMERCATLHNRTFTSNVYTIDKPRLGNLHCVVRHLNPTIFAENRPEVPDRNAGKRRSRRRLMEDGAGNAEEEDDCAWYQGSELYQCVDLLKQCLSMDCTTRTTAEDGLKHSFFTDY